MRDLLPSLKLNPRIHPHEFIRQVSDLLKDLDKFDGELIEEFMGKKDSLILNIRPCFKSAPRGLVGQMINSAEFEGKIVRIEIRAKGWNSNPPNYDSYVSTARRIFTPILKEYNRSHGTRLRLRPQSSVSLEPRISPKLKTYFDEFVGSATKDNLHPNDWKRFYAFIHAAHSFGTKLDRADIERLLVKHGFEEGYASEISEVYEHGRALLALK